jgi:20S proteasome subunit beta 7
MNHTINPTVTSSSVVGVKFNGGVMLAGDLLASYGSMAKYRRCSRFLRVNERTVLGSSGDYADFQFVRNYIEQRVLDDSLQDDGFRYTPSALHSWLARVMYGRRSKMDPLMNTFVVAGWQPDTGALLTPPGHEVEGKPFLGYVDKMGVSYTTDVVASGVGLYFALPMLREAYERSSGALTEADARALLERTLQLLFYRHSLAYNSYEVAVVTSREARIDGPFELRTDWTVAQYADPEATTITLEQLK